MQLAIEPPSMSALTELLKTSALATLMPLAGTTCLILVDCNVLGESDSRPHLRMCPMSQNICRKWLHSIRQARGAASVEN